MTWTIDRLRNEWRVFFEGKKHLYEASASLLPANDPTLLFTSAGMVPYKDYYSGSLKPPSPSICSVQKCVRTTDLEEVGKTKRHLTFFEMLGNFSFGSYFKEQAIEYAWEFSLKRLQFDPSLIHISVYLDDDEAYQLWEGKIKIPAKRIHRLPATENWWGPVGPSGVCGPCSELYYDRGKEFCENCDCNDKKNCKPGGEGDRFIEYWNLVFVQYFENKEKKRTPLKSPGIDTGSGAERLLMILNGQDTVFDTLEFQGIIKGIQRLAKKRATTFVPYQENLLAYRIIADHLRTTVFSIADGIYPSNVGRGYIIRRLIRRALMYSQKINITKIFLHDLVGVIQRIYDKAYPELQKSSIADIIKKEEMQFLVTLSKGLKIWDKMLSKTKRIFSGKNAFILYDTYGFPIELTRELAAQHNLLVDTKGFEQEMSEQKMRSSNDEFIEEVFDLSHLQEKKTKFIGYEQENSHATVLTIFDLEKKVTMSEIENHRINQNGKMYAVILDKTPFYPRGGGQNGDHGFFLTEEAANGDACFLVKDTIKQGETILHLGVALAALKVGDHLPSVKIDHEVRKTHARNHSATHLLNHQLRQLLGQQVLQSGSDLTTEHLRFDFTHPQPLTASQLSSIEQRINTLIQDFPREPVIIKSMKLAEAKRTGAIATFGEKYGDIVRVVAMGENGKFSQELCGGTHVRNLGEIESFFLVSETSSGAGIRRIIAITGDDLVQKTIAQRWESFLQQSVRPINEKLTQIQIDVDDLKKHFEGENMLPYYQENQILDIEKLRNHLTKECSNIIEFREQFTLWQERISKIRKIINKIVDKTAQREMDRSIARIEKNQVKKVSNTYIYRKKFENLKIAELRRYTDIARKKISPAVFILASQKEGMPIMLIVADKKVIQEYEINLSNIIKPITEILEGNGGGHATMVQIGGKRLANLDKAMKFAEEQITEELMRNI